VNNISSVLLAPCINCNAVVIYYSVASYTVPLMLWLMHVHITHFIIVKHTFVISWPPFCTLHRRYPQSKVQQQYGCCLSNPPQSKMKATPVHLSDNGESTDFYYRLAHNLANHKRNEKQNYNTSLFQCTETNTTLVSDCHHKISVLTFQ